MPYNNYSSMYPYNQPQSNYMYPYAQQQVPPNYAYQYNQQQMPVNQSGAFIWVNGRNEVDDYPTSPGVTDLFMERDRQVFYLKIWDVVEKRHIVREYEYREVVRPEIVENTNANHSYDSKEKSEIEYLASQISALTSQISEMRNLIENGGAKNA